MCDHLPMIACVQNPCTQEKSEKGTFLRFFLKEGGWGGGGTIHSLSRENLRFVTSHSRFALASSKYEAPEEEGAAKVIYFNALAGNLRSLWLLLL